MRRTEVRLRCLLVVVGLVLVVAGCRPKATPSTSEGDVRTDGSTASSSAHGESAAPGPILRGGKTALHPSPPPAELWNEFSGEKAMAQVEKQISFGPRPSGSAELAGAREVIISRLQEYGWAVEQQEFTADTPRGPIKFINVIARLAGQDGHPSSLASQKVIVCSHYDTKRFSTIRFVGASDGASSTGALLELARVLALDSLLASRVELVFFDGEEAVQQFTEFDGLYGSNHYAIALAASGRARQFKCAILWDMIGDKDLTITLPPDSPSELARGIFDSASALKLRQNFSYLSHNLLDDHVPLAHHGIPAIDLIDFDYLPWHTADDTLDKLSPDSLHKVGAVTIHYLTKIAGS